MNRLFFQTRPFMRSLSNSFKSSPSETPGFILYESKDQLHRPIISGQESPDLPLLTPFQLWKQTQNRLPLGDIKSERILTKAIRDYENQEPCRFQDALKRTAAAKIPKAVEGVIAEAMVVTDLIMRNHDSLLVDDESSIDNHSTNRMHAMSILKWRRRKMRGHKYKKRLRKNRYKTKI